MNIPPQWLQFDKMSQPIVCPSRPNIIFFAVRTPLPASWQVYFPPNDRWTVELAVSAACREFGVAQGATRILSIETNGPADLMDPDDCDALAVHHIYQPIDDSYPVSAIDTFIETVCALPTPGQVHIILVNYHNGHNRPGFLIAGPLGLSRTMFETDHDAVILRMRDANPALLVQRRLFSRIAPRSAFLLSREPSGTLD
jgi:hypothetical protein